MLRIEHLTKTFGEKKAVDDLSLHIRPGEIYGFIGHNGAGKTTTIKACCGIMAFDAGEIYIDGKNVKKQPLECKRETAYIPDNPDLYDFLSGIKYLNFVCDIFGVPQAERQERIHKYAGIFELTDDLAEPISAYSHGMKQKLAIISALVHSPKLIIMDEPFVGARPRGLAQAQGADARALRRRRRHLLLHARAGGGREALRHGGHHQGAGGSSSPAPWTRCAATIPSRTCSSSWRRSEPCSRPL